MTHRAVRPRRGGLRVAVRTAVMPAAMAPVLLAATPALATSSGWRGAGIPALEVIGVFIGIPLGLFIVISVLFVLLPSWVSESRQYPERTWTAGTTWFEGPRGGQQSVDVAEPSQDGGGASGRW